MLTGIGFDVHRLVENRELVLGGVKIPHTKGLEGHSDADVLLHAVCDALLGAAGLGDIGSHFPDTDESYKNVSSQYLLAEVNKRLIEKNLRVNNIDAVIAAEEPVLSPYKEQMKNNIGKILEINHEKVNIKATTTEGLGFIGEKKGISALAAVSVLTTNYS